MYYHGPDNTEPQYLRYLACRHEESAADIRAPANMEIILHYCNSRGRNEAGLDHYNLITLVSCNGAEHLFWPFAAEESTERLALRLAMQKDAIGEGAQRTFREAQE